MKIIRYDKEKVENRPDGRTVYHFMNHLFASNRESKFFKVTIPKGTIEKEHLHAESEEIFLFLTPGQIIIENNPYDLKEGDIVILEKNEKHKIIAKTDMELIGIKNPDLNDKKVIENENN